MARYDALRWGRAQETTGRGTSVLGQQEALGSVGPVQPLGWRHVPVQQAPLAPQGFPALPAGRQMLRSNSPAASHLKPCLFADSRHAHPGKCP